MSGRSLGVANSQSCATTVQVPYTASSVTQAVFIAKIPCVVTGIDYRQRVASTSGTAQFYKAASGVAAASGSALHSTAFDLSNAVTVDTNYSATLVSDSKALTLSPGDSINVVFGGTMTNGVGYLQVFVEPLS